jgi:hypothetical protein
MGHTKTICCNVKPHHAADYQAEWDDLRRDRQALIVALEDYLSDKACVPGVPKDPTGLHPRIDLLASAYTAMTKSELLEQTDATQSIRSMKAFALLFSELYLIPGSHFHKSLDQSDEFSIGFSIGDGNNNISIDDFDNVVSKTLGVHIAGEIESESMKLAELLSKVTLRHMQNMLSHLR